MLPFFSLKYKKIGILGLGRTGKSVYEALNSIAQVICYDDIESNRDAFIAAYGKQNIVQISDQRWQDLDNIVLSPGIAPSHEIMKTVKAHNIPIISDIDLLFSECKSSKFISITGTNGKSTTTALIDHIFKSAGYDYQTGGNIGKPVLRMPFDKPGYILELSSFQLDLLKNFCTDIAILLNITPDHLDRYITMESYINSKKKIFSLLREGGHAIINVDDESNKQVISRLFGANLGDNSCNAKLITISTDEIQPLGVAVLSGMIHDNLFDKGQFKLPYNKFLLGQHNRENIAASYAASRIVGIEPAEIIAAISSFVGLTHRMQHIGNTNDVDFYNDSKATNFEAASKSIAALDNIYWLVGGILKEKNILPLEPWLENIRKAYIFGRDREYIATMLSNKVQYIVCDDLEEAFMQAYEDATSDKKTGKNILLAPACASYDQFKDFEHRGEIFMAMCRSTITNQNNPF